MDPHPTPFAGKRRSVAAPAAPSAKAAAPKPKSIAAARAARMAKRSPTGNANAAPQPRPPRRAFGTVRNSNAPAEKPPTTLQKPSKVSPPPPQKPAKVSPPPVQKHSKMSPPAMQKPSKLSPPNPVRGTKPSRPMAKPLKKAAPAVDAEAKAKKRSQRVSFLVAAAEATAPGSGEKAKASADDAAGRTPMVAMRTAEKPAKIVAAETPFFSAQNCSSCTLDQLESASYWLAQIRLAESVGKHWVAAAFFRLAFQCQAQPNHRIQSELRNYTVRHESAGTLAPLFGDLLTAHGMLVNQPKFDTEGLEKVDTPLATNLLEQKLDSATVKVDEGMECDCHDDPVDVDAVIVDKHCEDSVDHTKFERKLDESFKVDDCEAVIVDGLEEANFDRQDNAEMKVPFSSEIVQSECRTSIEKLTPRKSTVDMDSSSEWLSFEKPLNKLSPIMMLSSAKRLSSGGSPFNTKSPLSSKRLTSSCPSYKKSVSVRDRSSKQMTSDIYSDRENNTIAATAERQTNENQNMGSKHPSLDDQLETKEPAEDAANNEIH